MSTMVSVMYISSKVVIWTYVEVALLLWAEYSVLASLIDLL